MMGLDIGDKRIGVALCDPMGILASAHGVIERKGDEADIQAIHDLAQNNDVEQIIIGLPRLLEGGIGTQAQKTIDFADQLSPPTLIAHSKSDPLAPFADAQWLAQTIPGATFLPVEDGGHVFFVVRSEQVIPEITAFLEAHAA